MAVVVGEMTVEPAVEPAPAAAGTDPGHAQHGPLPAQLYNRIEQPMRAKAERRERLRAD